ncbi:MAG TPA: peptidylprolyl isomerase [Acidimicrobiales bacterium]|nr:peptidylprolyl isomerase [Acidimicrobiales bacterium]
MANRAAARERAKRTDREAAQRQAAARALRRRRIIAIVAVVVALLFVVGFVLAAANSNNGQSATSTTTLDQTSTSVTDGPTVSVPPGQGGAAITGPTPCPAGDGSSPRTTSFAHPPPTCIDPTKTYDAIMDTSEGSFTFLLQSKLAPRSVNNFVVLARYHYWDGTPVTSITTDTTMQAGLVVNADGTPGPGYTLPAEYQRSGKTVGVIIVPGTLAMAPASGTGDAIGGELLLALGNRATDLPPTTTVVGLMLSDPGNTLHKIDELGTQGGGPTKLVTIKSVRIVPAPVSK